MQPHSEPVPSPDKCRGLSYNPANERRITMANKNTAGSTLARFKAKEKRLIEKLDWREKTGKNKENTDNVFQNFAHITKGGERVWSF
jgi:hypothetical protein